LRVTNVKSVKKSIHPTKTAISLVTKFRGVANLEEGQFMYDAEGQSEVSNMTNVTQMVEAVQESCLEVSAEAGAWRECDFNQK